MISDTVFCIVALANVFSKELKVIVFFGFVENSNRKECAYDGSFGCAVRFERGDLLTCTSINLG